VKTGEQEKGKREKKANKWGGVGQGNEQFLIELSRKEWRHHGWVGEKAEDGGRERACFIMSREVKKP